MKQPLLMYVVYDRPEDYPQHIVVRKWAATAVGNLIPGPAELYDTLAEARDGIGMGGRICTPRSPEDDPYIVETWW